jgi:VCBS repeat protein
VDFNQDGKLDLVFTDRVRGQLFILLGNGDGSFQPTPLLATPSNVSLSDARMFVVGDFNRDGKLDIAVPQVAPLGRGEVATVLLGNGDGTVGAMFDSRLGVDRAGSILAADLNGDGGIDLIFSDEFFSIAKVLLSFGNGTFHFPQIYSAPVLGSITHLVPGDFNGDGKLDVALVGADRFRNVPDQIAILPGNGDGTFDFLGIIGPVFTDGLGMDCAAGDFNNDGKLDFVLAGGTVEILLQE